MICTRDRPQEIADCLASCAELDHPAGLRIFVCVADNNAVPQEQEIRQAATAHHIDLAYGHEPERGYASVRNRALSPNTAVFGEVGLSGEIRGIPQAALRIREAAQMGFTRIVLPEANLDPADDPSEGRCELVGVRALGEALDALLA